MRPNINPSLELLFGARVRFLDGIHGHLTGIRLDAESRTMTGIGVSEHPNGEQFYVSIDVITAGFPDCVHLNQRRDSTSPEPGPASAWLSPDQPVRWVGPNGVGARLQGAIVHRETGRLRTLLIAAGERDSLLCLNADEITEIPNAVVFVRPGAARWNDLPEYGVDEDVQKDTLEEMGREGLPPPQNAESLPTDVRKRRQV